MCTMEAGGGRDFWLYRRVAEGIDDLSQGLAASEPDLLAKNVKLRKNIPQVE